MARGRELLSVLVLLKRVMVGSFESPRELQPLVEPGRELWPLCEAVKDKSNSNKQGRAGVMPRSLMGLIAKLDLPGSASCITWINDDNLAESL